MLNLIRKARIQVRSLLGKEIPRRVDVRIPTQRFGSTYGGWNVFTDHLNSDSVVYSVGVGQDVSFDNAIIKRFGLTIHGLDPTPKAVEWIKKQQMPHNFIMHQYGVASFDGSIQFNGPRNPDDISFSICESYPGDTQAIEAPVKRLETIRQEQGHSEIAILKMDIEGAEYEVVDDMISSGIKPQLIIIEYHHRFSSIGMQKTYDSIAAIRNAGYQLYWVSDSRMECGLIRNDLIKQKQLVVCHS